MFKYSNDQIGPVSPAENFCFWQGFNVCLYCLICFVLFVFSLKLLKKTDKNDADMYVTKSLNPIGNQGHMRE